jgi:hypothetical protein
MVIHMQVDEVLDCETWRCAASRASCFASPLTCFCSPFVLCSVAADLGMPSPFFVRFELRYIPRRTSAKFASMHPDVCCHFDVHQEAEDILPTDVCCGLPIKSTSVCLKLLTEPCISVPRNCCCVHACLCVCLSLL